ncbi:hypothetical protein [Lederbergia lenta]|uniref:hypothetical protein n=1 Tax=Lederbergia lenta TaxID=1467 RepID=UPI00203C4AF2|nr:hypothetical protein [Lederbergia lenta]MCM3109933.1 hypothetical protein [Lederbergia lenta]
MDYEEKLNLLNKIGKAKVLYSDFTNKFYLSTNLEIKNGNILNSPCEHRETIEEAVNATFRRFSEANVIVADAYSLYNRKEYSFVNGGFVTV